MARSVRALMPEDLIDVTINILEPDARGWLAAVTSSLPHAQLTQIVVTLWAVWYARRKAIYEEEFQSPLSMFSFINRFIADLSLVKPDTKQQKMPARAVPGWIPPPVGMAKINVDATLSKGSGCGGSGGQGCSKYVPWSLGLGGQGLHGS